MIHSSLSALNKVLKGVTLLSTAVHKLASSLMKHEVKYNYKCDYTCTCSNCNGKFIESSILSLA